MTALDTHTELPPPHHKALARAHAQLETRSFAVRLAEVAGKPLDRVLGMVPKVAAKPINLAVEAAILNCLKLAISSLEPNARRAPSDYLAPLVAGLSGGVSGFFGFAALPIELPVTTTLMLRTIAGTARHNGEDLRTLEARLACLEVFALGGGRSSKRIDLGYYASRAMLSKFAGEASALLIERGAASVSAPLVNRFLAEIVARYGTVVSERIAASAVPVIGAVGGAAVNVAFMNHFQRVAQGHFTIRRLERHYGASTIRRHYQNLS
jgi:hypothetical protein